MRTILLDADLLAYAVAFTSEASHFGGECEDVRPEEIPGKIEDRIMEYCDEIGDVGRVVVCLSDDRNWRKEFEPTYKANRSGVAKPQLLDAAKEYLSREYPSYIRPRLEGDDVQGILATDDEILLGEKIMVSSDKDMRTIPAKLWNPNRPELGVIDISPLDADRFHMWQTVVGDPVDGYPGCPGAGPAAAADIPFATRSELWDLVLECYAIKGLSEDAAIHQARLASILRATDYNYATQKLLLWEPHWLIR